LPLLFLLLLETVEANVWIPKRMEQNSKKAYSLRALPKEKKKKICSLMESE